MHVVKVVCIKCAFTSQTPLSWAPPCPNALLWVAMHSKHSNTCSGGQGYCHATGEDLPAQAGDEKENWWDKATTINVFVLHKCLVCLAKEFGLAISNLQGTTKVTYKAQAQDQEGPSGRGQLHLCGKLCCNLMHHPFTPNWLWNDNNQEECHECQACSIYFTPSSSHPGQTHI